MHPVPVAFVNIYVQLLMALEARLAERFYFLNIASE